MAIVSLPWYYVNPFLKSVQEAEDILGEPPNFMQIFYVLETRHNVKLKNTYMCAAVMFSLLREDLLYTDAPVAYRWTCHKREGFMNYTEIFNKHF